MSLHFFLIFVNNNNSRFKTTIEQFALFTTYFFTIRTNLTQILTQIFVFFFFKQINSDLHKASCQQNMAAVTTHNSFIFFLFVLSPFFFFSASFFLLSCYLQQQRAPKCKHHQYYMSRSSSSSKDM